MPTNGDETLSQRYQREHAEHLARLAEMTPEQMAAIVLDLHNAQASMDKATTLLAEARSRLADVASSLQSWKLIEQIDDWIKRSKP
jgi:predicted deacylase